MKFVILFCLVLLTLGLRSTHKSQYDLGYEAGLEAASQDVDIEGQSGCPFCFNVGCFIKEFYMLCDFYCGC